jgi:hypothetical protein
MHRQVLVVCACAAVTALAGVGFPFACDTLGCSMCNVQRMKHVCYRHCQLNCVSDVNAIGGVSAHCVHTHSVQFISIAETTVDPFAADITTRPLTNSSGLMLLPTALTSLLQKESRPLDSDQLKTALGGVCACVYERLLSCGLGKKILREWNLSPTLFGSVAQLHIGAADGNNTFLPSSSFNIRSVGGGEQVTPSAQQLVVSTVPATNNGVSVT